MECADQVFDVSVHPSQPCIAAALISGSVQLFSTVDAL